MDLKKLEAVYECIANGEIDQADKLFHRYIVETASAMYAEMETPAFENGLELGGDSKEDFVNDVESEDNMDSDFGDDGLDFDAAEGHAEDESVEDRVNELESELEALKAEFDRLMSGEAMGDVDGDGDHDMADHEAEEDDSDIDFDSESEEDYSGDSDDEGEDDESEDEDKKLDEATEFYKKVALSMNKEAGDTNTDNTFARGKKFTDNMSGGAHKIGEGGDEKGGKASAKKHEVEDNVDVAPHKKVSGVKEKESADSKASSILGSRKKNS